MSKIGASILRGMKGAIAFAEDTADMSLYRIHIPAEIDAKVIRGRLGLTQQQFAVRFGFSVNTLRHWEQGRRVPEGPTRACLLVIDREPLAVQKALRIA
jgi:putative transcriptional regulator